MPRCAHSRRSLARGWARRRSIVVPAALNPSRSYNRRARALPGVSPSAVAANAPKSPASIARKSAEPSPAPRRSGRTYNSSTSHTSPCSFDLVRPVRDEECVPGDSATHLGDNRSPPLRLALEQHQRLPDLFGVDRRDPRVLVVQREAHRDDLLAFVVSCRAPHGNLLLARPPLELTAARGSRPLARGRLWAPERRRPHVSRRVNAGRRRGSDR